MDFAVRWTATADCLVLRVGGELDIATAPVLAAAAAAALDAAPHVRLDLGGITFVDAAGLGALVTGRRYAAERGAVLEFAAAAEPVLRLFALTGLAEALPATVPAPPAGGPAGTGQASASDSAGRS